jgi:hypothetical protein
LSLVRASPRVWQFSFGKSCVLPSCKKICQVKIKPLSNSSLFLSWQIKKPEGPTKEFVDRYIPSARGVLGRRAADRRVSRSSSPIHQDAALQKTPSVFSSRRPHTPVISSSLCDPSPPSSPRSGNPRNHAYEEIPGSKTIGGFIIG